MTIQITVLGLGQIGTSVGLALADQKEKFKRVGNDRDVSIARQAEKLGAFDQTTINLPSSVSKADVVVLALPVDEIVSTLKTISTELMEGAVIIDMAPLKNAVATWAEEILPEGCHFVSVTPALNPAYIEEAATGVAAAHADLFKGSPMFITSLRGSSPEALRLAADFVSLLGGTPLFSDPYETDGLLAAAHLLPQLAAAALVRATIDQPGWTETRKLAGKPYAHVSFPLEELSEYKALGQTALLNKDNTVRVINNLISALIELRDDIANQNQDELNKKMQHAQEGRREWMKQRLANDWSAQGTKPQIPTSGEMLGRLIGLRPKSERKKKN